MSSEKPKKTERRMTPSSVALAAVVIRYRTFNDELEKSLDETEDRIPTRTKVRTLLDKIAQKQT